MRKEMIKEINGFNKYKISEEGIIYSLKGEPMSYSNYSGYLGCGITNDNGIRVNVLVHRIVALNFIENPHHKEFVNHKDGNKLNNRKENLEWSTPKENGAHASISGFYRKGQRNPKARLIINIATGIFYESIKEAADSTSNLKRFNIDSALLKSRVNNTNFRYA